jgi:hypothetical protein
MVTPEVAAPIIWYDAVIVVLFYGERKGFSTVLPTYLNDPLKDPYLLRFVPISEFRLRVSKGKL